MHISFWFTGIAHCLPQFFFTQPMIILLFHFLVDTQIMKKNLHFKFYPRIYIFYHDNICVPYPVTPNDAPKLYSTAHGNWEITGFVVSNISMAKTVCAICIDPYFTKEIIHIQISQNDTFTVTCNSYIHHILPKKYHNVMLTHFCDEAIIMIRKQVVSTSLGG